MQDSKRTMRTDCKTVLVWATLITASCGATQPSSDLYIQGQERIINAHAEMLRNQGRMPTPDHAGAFAPFEVLGQYAWHDGTCREGKALTPCSFGAYSFSRPAYDQARRAWWIHGQMQSGSDVLTATNPNAKFDVSIVGYQVGFMYQGPERARVIRWIDEHSVQLDQVATKPVNQYGLSLLPESYVDLCNCHVPSTVQP